MLTVLSVGLLVAASGFAVSTPATISPSKGEPGDAYWQQQVDCQIGARLDEAGRGICATETIRYQHNSRNSLKYVWWPLD